MLSAVAKKPSSHCCHPTLSEEVHQQIPSIIGLAGSPPYYYILLVGYERELHLMRPSPGTVVAGGSPGCWSIFHCI